MREGLCVDGEEGDDGRNKEKGRSHIAWTTNAYGRQSRGRHTGTAGGGGKEKVFWIR